MIIYLVILLQIFSFGVSVSEAVGDDIKFFTSNNLIPISELPEGSVIRDPLSLWNFKTEENYGGDIVKSEPVEWIILSHGHFDSNATLLHANQTVARYNFESTGLKNTNGPWESRPIRNWLRSTFYNHMSDKFKNSIVPVNTYNNTITTEDTVFLLSLKELGYSDSGMNGYNGLSLSYFNTLKSRIRISDYETGLHEGNASGYWTRTPYYSSDNDQAFYITNEGHYARVSVTQKVMGVVPAINIKSDTLVESSPGEDGVYNLVWNVEPLLTNIKPSTNSYFG